MSKGQFCIVRNKEKRIYRPSAVKNDREATVKALKEYERVLDGEVDAVKQL